MTTAIRQPFARLRTRARAAILLEALGVLAVAAAIFIVLSFVLDRSLRLETGYRAALLAVFGLGVARIVHRRLFRPLGVQLSDDELALAVERREPPLQEALISAVQFERMQRDPSGRAARGDSRQMMQLVVGQVHERVRRIHYGAAIDGARSLRYGACMVVFAAAAAAWLALDRGTFKLWFQRNVLLAATEWPRRTQLQFVDPVLRLPQGDDLTVRVAAHGEVPELVRLHYRFAGGEHGAEAMTLTGTVSGDAEFRTTLTALLEAVTLYAEGGDGETEGLRVEIVDRPVITGLQVTVEPPAYAGGAVESPADSDIRVLRGSKVKVRARSDKPVREAFLLVGDARQVPIQVDADQHAVFGEIVPEETGGVILDVVDHDRLGAKSPPRLFLRVQDDQAPAVDLRLRGIGSMVTQVARIPADLTVRDDLGLTAVSAWHRISGQPAVPASAADQPAPDANEPLSGQPLSGQPAVPAAPEPAPEFAPIAVSGLEGFVKNERQLQAAVVVDLREIAAGQPAITVEPGQILALRFAAVDTFGPGEPHTTACDAAVLRIVTPEELAADLQRRQLEQRKLLEGLLAQHMAARARLQETMNPAANPAASDPRAAQARQQLLQIGKTERDLGVRAGAIGQSYAQILDEAQNNRIAEAGALRGMRERVVQPLSQLSADDFPQAAGATDAYANAGNDDLKQVAITAYDSITSRIKSILAQMMQEERLAAVIAELREQLKLWGANTDEVSKRRGEAGSEFFGPGRDDKVKPPNPPKDGDKK